VTELEIFSSTPSLLNVVPYQHWLIYDIVSGRCAIHRKDEALSTYRTLLERGYFPKELPPAFSTDSFAKYAASSSSRSILLKYKAAENFTECLKYQLARPGLNRRELRIPHPASYAGLAALTAKNFERLMGIANGSTVSRSRPIWAAGRHRSILPLIAQTNLVRERAVNRAGSSFLLTTDISQFYPSLYTHAIGWAVDPKLRNRANWKNPNLLGKKLDQALMDLDGKVSQGIPIGNDISFLLSELVLARVDKAAIPRRGHALRWYDDYEVAVDTYEQAEVVLKKLSRELGKFRLRLNPKKTTITRLPAPAQDPWQEALRQVANGRFTSAQSMIRYFDTAFRLREQNPDEPVMMYALGLLFKLACPTTEVGRVAQSCITQSLLCEPGAAQKGFTLLTFWGINGLRLDTTLITNTVNRMVIDHQAMGVSSDVAWALAFCLDHRYGLSVKAAKVLSAFGDDCITLQALDMERSGLLTKGFSKNQIAKGLKDADLDREHWLVAYETVRHGFLTVCAPAVQSNPLFSDLLNNKVTFYRRSLPHYAAVLHAGGAPDWIVQQWISILLGDEPKSTTETQRAEIAALPVVNLLRADLATAMSASDPENPFFKLIGLDGHDAMAGDSDTY
jgi:hypothetical protein